MRLTPIVNTRTPCKTSWWRDKSNRMEAEDEEDFTYPFGYEKKRLHEDYEFNHLVNLQ